MNFHLIGAANYRGIKVFLQANYEFLDYLRSPELPHPYRIIAPSPWHMDDMRAKIGDELVRYVPPPTVAGDFTSAWEENSTRTGRRRFLHIVGQPAAHDRNGTEILIAALEHTQRDFELELDAQFLGCLAERLIDHLRRRRNLGWALCQGGKHFVVRHGHQCLGLLGLVGGCGSFSSDIGLHAQIDLANARHHDLADLAKERAGENEDRSGAEHSRNECRRGGARACRGGGRIADLRHDGSRVEAGDDHLENYSKGYQGEAHGQ
jgi:hypothetical protein